MLVVGGGLVGLAAGLFLHRQGVPFVLIEQRETPSILPRARGIHVRSMELFRQVGVEAEMQAAAKAAWKVGAFGGARRGPSMLASEPIADFSKVTVRSVTGGVPSPSAFCACPQDTIEEILHRRLSGGGGDVRFGQRLETFTQDEQGVSATVKDARGNNTHIRADFLIAADGGRGPVRHQLQIGSERTEAERHYLNIFFRADLTARMQGRTFSQCEVENGRVNGLLISNDNATEWSFHLEYDPQATDPQTFTQADLTAFVGAALGEDRIGDAEVPVEIVATATWSTVVRVAERYREGRVFLVGDAAHVMPPWGGFGGNTGIADANDLCWKLAAVLGGRAGEALLNTYETERRPVARRNGAQARLRTDFDARFGIETSQNCEVMPKLIDMDTLHMKFPYPLPGAPVQPPERLAAQVGTRFPHAWLLRAGERVSTLDLFGGPPTLLAGPEARRAWNAEGQGWAEGAEVVQMGRDVLFADAETTWTQLTDLPADGAVLVRPDGFVCQRSDTNLH